MKKETDITKKALLSQKIVELKKENVMEMI